MEKYYSAWKHKVQVKAEEKIEETGKEVNDPCSKLAIGQLHDDVTLLQLPESLSLLFSCAN